MVYTGDTLEPKSRAAEALEAMTCPPQRVRVAERLIRLEPEQPRSRTFGIEGGEVSD
jgi:hypothetical protein